jgi:hypothetical protein
VLILNLNGLVDSLRETGEAGNNKTAVIKNKK